MKDIDYYNKALNIILNIYREQHPLIPDSYISLSILYNNIKDSKTAFDYFNKALNINLRVYGKQHLDTANSFYN